MNARRLFLASSLLWAAGGAAIAQPPRVRRVIIRMPGTLEDQRSFGWVMRERLAASLAPFGYVEGRNLELVDQFMGEEHEVSHAHLAQIRERTTDAIVSVGTWATVPLRDAVRDIPIVAWAIEDPVGAGLARSFTRPGGNVTGLTQGKEGIYVKQVDFLAAIVPGLQGIAVLGFRGERTGVDVLKQFDLLERAIVEKGLIHRLVPTVGPRALDAMSGLRAGRIQAAIYFHNPAPLGRETQRLHAEAAIRHRIAVLGYFANMAEDGFLASYGELDDDLFHRLAQQLDRVLRGVDPGQIPFMGPRRFHLRVNARTAMRLGLEVTPRVRLMADEVIA
jgi:putative ABC transport system substrate-binding protein